MVREQYFMLLIDEERALAQIPSLIGTDPERSENLLPLLRRVLTARGPLSAEREKRMTRVAALLGAPQRPRSVA
jgi:hypothetical protein